jgi:hypothetical protein
LGHTPNKFIKLSIEHSIGLEKLNGKKFSEHQTCPLCMIGKSQLNDKPESIQRAEKPLAKVNFDLVHLQLPQLKDTISVLCSLTIALNIDGHMD